MEPINLFEFEPLARETLPKPIYDFIAGGAEDEVTLRENRAAFERLQLLPRMLVDVTAVETATEVLGQLVPYPILLAPAGSQGAMHPQGELATARAAASAGTVMVLSTMSSYTIEQVAEVADGPRWFQLYLLSREIARQLVERAETHGYSAICLTVDAPRHGHRERDIRNQPPPTPSPNVDGLIDWSKPVPERAPSWEDVDWLRSLTDLPLILKGIMTPDDARLAVAHGVSAIVVSNHGGRQLDGVPSTIDVLPEIVDAVGGRAEVLLDGGVRRGIDVLKALALGARAVLIGRPYLWGLAVDGEAGVKRVLKLLSRELEDAMALAGCPSVATIGRALVRHRPRAVGDQRPATSD